MDGGRRGVAWWVVMPLYAAAGLGLGLADPALGGLAARQGLRPGVATAVVVNAVLPLAAVALAAARPRLATAWLGGLALTLSYTLGLAARYAPAGGLAVAALVRSVPPVLVLAGLGYLVLGTLTALAVRAGRGGPMTSAHPTHF